MQNESNKATALPMRLPIYDVRGSIWESTREEDAISFRRV